MAQDVESRRARKALLGGVPLGCYVGVSGVLNAGVGSGLLLAEGSTGGEFNALYPALDALAAVGVTLACRICQAVGAPGKILTSIFSAHGRE